MKKYLFAALFAMTAFAACKKEAPQQQINAGHSFSAQAMSKDDDDNCANPNNPYDKAGYDHNMALQATRCVWGQANATMSQTYTAVADYYQAKYGANSTLPDEATWIANATAVNADKGNSYANIISNSNLSDEGKTVATQFVAMTSNIPASTTYAAYKSMIVDYETDVMADNNLTDADKEMLLTSSSIARYSMGYWINEMTDGNPTGSNPVQCRNIFHKIGDWWDRATARFDIADYNNYTPEDKGASALGASLGAFFGL